MNLWPLTPDDELNRRLVELTHPPGWENPHPPARYDLVAIGGGTAGLVAAVGAAGLGARVALVERYLLGGDCLNVGCVPSKALLRAANAAREVRTAAALGIGAPTDAPVDFARVMERMRAVRASLAPNDSAARLRSLGVDVYLGEARFVSADAIEVAGRVLRFSRAVVATGSHPDVPDLPGLREAGFLTNESVFSLEERPASLVVLGAGPVGCELAQAFARLGTDVTIVGRAPRVLPRDDPDASARLAASLARDGVRLELGAEATRVERRPSGSVVFCQRGAERLEVPADTILVAVGRRPNVQTLGLERAGVRFTPRGVEVDDFLRTSNRRIFAAGDVTGLWQFTHASDGMARIVIQNALFFGRRRASRLVMPWCTYTQPEVAHVGLSAAQAAAGGSRTFTVELEAVDRAVIDDEADGFARVHADRRGRILGATVVAADAGDLIATLTLAITARATLGTLSRTVHPYPTQADALRKLGDAWMRSRLTPRAKRLLAAVLRVRRGGRSAARS